MAYREPTISGVDGNLGDKNLGFTYDYTVNDAHGDTLTVTEQLNDETIRMINNASKGEALGVMITSEKLYTLSPNSVTPSQSWRRTTRAAPATGGSHSSAPTAHRQSPARTLWGIRPAASLRRTPSPMLRAIMWSSPSSWTICSQKLLGYAGPRGNHRAHPGEAAHAHQW